MADIALIAEKIAPVYSDRAEIINHVAGVDLTSGDAITFNSIGAVIKADADDNAANTFRGIAIETVKAGQPVAILYRGHVYGFTVAGLNANSPLYVSDSVGKLADAASPTKSMVAGYVVALSDKTKVVYVDGFIS